MELFLLLDGRLFACTLYCFAVRVWEWNGDGDGNISVGSTNLNLESDCEGMGIDCMVMG